jgi:2'-5' RNA ligase
VTDAAYGLNVVVPNSVRGLAAELEPALSPFDHIRDRHTLLLKRFEGERSRHRLRERVVDCLAGAEPVDARITGIEAFWNPPAGSSPVVYLSVESPGIWALHRRLVEEFGRVPGLEGDEYTPHVTLARDLPADTETAVGSMGADDPVAALKRRDLPELTWTVDELGLWSKEYREFVTRFSLPP